MPTKELRHFLNGGNEGETQEAQLSLSDLKVRYGNGMLLVVGHEAGYNPARRVDRPRI